MEGAKQLSELMTQQVKASAPGQCRAEQYRCSSPDTTRYFLSVPFTSY